MFLLIKLAIMGVGVYTGRRTYKESGQLIKKESRLPVSKDQNTIISHEENRDEIDKELNKNLNISLVSLGLAIVGPFVFPPLTILCVPLFIWGSLSIIKDAYRSVFIEHRIRFSVLDTIFFTGIIINGSFFAGSLALLMYAIGRKVLRKTEDHSKLNLSELFGVQQGCSVWLVKEGVEIKVPLETLKKGDTIVMNAGEMIPADGVIVDGFASVDQHILTGEAQPVEKETNDRVFSSTFVLSGRILLQIEKTGTETVTAQIGKMLLNTADFRKSIQSRGDKMADQSASPTLLMSLATLPTLGTTSSVTMMNSCFGIYIRSLAPISMLVYLSIASRAGILIKDGRSLEFLKEVDTVIFDKTGTLTLEEPQIGKIYTYNGFSENEVLMFAAAAEHYQTHPIARAILQAAHKHDFQPLEIEEAKYEVGYGIKVYLSDRKNASINNQAIRVGSLRFMEMEGIAISDEIKSSYEYGYRQGYSFVYVAVDDKICGTIELHATIRPEAKQIISQLHLRGITTYIISGDHKNPTKRLADELGIDHYFAEALPEHKADLVSQLQNEGKFVCFVGDGINDSIALRKANVSVSLQGASTIATNSAQIILMDESLNKLIVAFDIANHFDSNMKTNMLATIIPGLVTIAGVLFLHFTILDSVILNQMGFWTGMVNTALPLRTREKKVARATPRVK